MSTAFGRPQGGRGSGPCGQDEGGQKADFFVDVINGWPLNMAFLPAVYFRTLQMLQQRHHLCTFASIFPSLWNRLPPCTAVHSTILSGSLSSSFSHLKTCLFLSGLNALGALPKGLC